jgi:broad specificity phosphatase PhoE
MTTLVLCRHAAVGADPADVAAAAAPYGPAALYTSPLERAVRTAAAIGERCGLEAVVDDRLREIDFGEVEGLAFDELPRELRRGLVHEPTTVRFPGGETYAELRVRVVAALDEIVARQGARSVVVVSHAGAIRAALATYLQMPDAAVFRLGQRHGAVNVVDVIAETPVVRLLNG